MPESVRKYNENVELEIYRNTPFEFIATAESGPSVKVATTTVTRPKGSWLIVDATQHSIPASPKSPAFGLK
jgi:hypothetical protein